jgi:hypothetical protein
MDHREILQKLGGGTVVADRLSTMTKTLVDREAVYKWREKNSIPHRWRPFIAQLAAEARIRLPKNFIPGVTA